MEKAYYTKANLVCDKNKEIRGEIKRLRRKMGVSAICGHFFFVQKCDILISLKMNQWQIALVLF